jgi:2-succinyl-6-hydroxy-2,4-cyclohexadiene-1-carboxylate synthase
VTTIRSLASEHLGDGDETLVFVHGFTQTRVMWRDIATSLTHAQPNLRCVLVDLPGHGDSAALTDSPRETAQLLVETGGHATYVGYSLGARVVLQALVDSPQLIRAAVSISGTGGIEDEAERSARRASDVLLAERVQMIGVEAFLNEWLAQPLFADMTPRQSSLADRMRNTASGLAHSLTTCGQGQQLPLWNALGISSAPVLAIAGSRDAKYVALARRLATTIPQGTLEIVADAGHNIPATHPESIVGAIREWLPRTN